MENMSKKNNSLWVEKYRPQDLSTFVGNETLKTTIDKFLQQNDIINMLFYGPAGCGKTTLAKLIVSNLDCDYLSINASDERVIETIRDKVQGFASVNSFKPLKIIILDEADFLTIQAQASLRNIIETFSRTTRFILTCNYVERIIDPLQSRCQVLKIVPPSKSEVAKHVAGILEKENSEYDINDLKSVVNQYYPDLRKILNTLQLSNQDGKIVMDKTLLVSNSYMAQVLKELQAKSPNWRTIRQIIADANINDFEELYRYLYDNASDYASGNEGMVAIYINEYTYQSNFRIDKEICTMALISRLIELSKPQLIK
jgi:replication factor C small subunit